VGSKLGARTIRLSEGNDAGSRLQLSTLVKFRIARILAIPLVLAVVVTVSTAGSGSPDDLNQAARIAPKLAVAAAQVWPTHLVSTADLEGPPVVVPGTEEAFALHGNNGEEISSEPLERVNLASGDIAEGPGVPDDAILGVVGTRIVLVAPERYGANGVATPPWRVWTVNPNTLQLERPVTLSFVSRFGAVIPTMDPAPVPFDLWVSDGAALHLVDLVDGKVHRTIDIPALDLSVDPTGRRLYVLTGTSASTTTAPAYRADTILELNNRTGSIAATSTRWAASPRLQIAASTAGVYLLDTGRARQSMVLLNARSLRPVNLPTALESTLATSLRKGEDVTTAPVDHGIVVGSAGRLTCTSPRATSVRVSTALAPGSVSWDVFAHQGTTLFAWSVSSTGDSSLIEAIVAPSLC
jgi:hypothetical protein